MIQKCPFDLCAVHCRVCSVFHSLHCGGLLFGLWLLIQIHSRTLCTLTVLWLSNTMTSLLTHTVAHSTRPSFRPKNNNQSTKKFLSLGVNWVKVIKMCKILTFKVNFLSQKLSKSFKKKFSLKNMILGAHFLLLTFFESFNF